MKRGLVAAVLALAVFVPVSAQESDVTAIRQVEDQFHTAKLRNDVATLDRIHHADYQGTNQSGRRRGKGEVLELWKSFQVNSLRTEVAQVRVTGTTAVVIGRMYEDSGTGTGWMLFTHTYLKGPQGWQLLANQQSWEPGQPGGMLARMAPAQPAVATVRTPPVTSAGGLTAEEIRVGGSCVVAVTRPGNSEVALAPCGGR